MICKYCGSVLSESGRHTNQFKKGWHEGDKYVRPNLYVVWCNMRARCRYKKHNRYANYGGRGIRVCQEWDDYGNFRRWCLDNGWQQGLQVDRIDNDGHYSPQNCRIVNRYQQQQNRRLPNRHRTGKRYNRRFMSEADVYMIRDSELTNAQLARMFDVHNATISKIKRRLTWRHLPEKNPVESGQEET